MMAEDSESKDEGVSQKTEQELVKLYKRRLENWREVLTHFNALVTWEKPYYPGIITGVVTLIFISVHFVTLLSPVLPYVPCVTAMFSFILTNGKRVYEKQMNEYETANLYKLLWYFDPSVLTTLSIFGIIACILDYVVPILSASFFDSSKWTGAQERKYEEICYELVSAYIHMKTIWDYARHIKETKPYVYFIGIVGTLIMTAWIGNVINNLFLTFLIVLFISLLPGIKSQGIVQRNISKVMAMIKGATNDQAKKKK